METPLEIRVGMDILFDGRQYVVGAFDHAFRADGQSLTLFAYEPFVYLRLQHDADQKRKAIETSIQVAKMAMKEMQ